MFFVNVTKKNKEKYEKYYRCDLVYEMCSSYILLKVFKQLFSYSNVAQPYFVDFNVRLVIHLMEYMANYKIYKT